MNDSYDKFFTSSFIQESPNILLKNYNNQFFKSLASLLLTIEKSLDLDISKFKDFFSLIDTTKILNQEIYALHGFLQKEVRKGDVRLVLELIKRLEEAFGKSCYSRSFSVQTISHVDWEEEIINDLRNRNSNNNGVIPSMKPIEDNAIIKITPTIKKSLELLESIAPLFYNEFTTYVSNLKLFVSDRLVGMTDVRAFGTIYLCMPPIDMPEQMYFCEHIIHETSHLHLHALFTLDRIVLNDSKERYSAPIRPDPRPMYGIFHATFVLSRMVRIFQLLAEKIDSSFEEYFVLFLKKFLKGYNTIKEFAKLTPLGEKIVSSYSDIISLYLVSLY